MLTLVGLLDKAPLLGAFSNWEFTKQIEKRALILIYHKKLR